jgi:putative oxidoreductase
MAELTRIVHVWTDEGFSKQFSSADGLEEDMDLGLFLLRATVGLTLAAHGAQKLVGWFGGHGLEGTGQFLESLGFRPGHSYARLVGLIETGGGIALAIGFLTPLAATLIFANMLVAALSVHVKQGFFVSNGGYEFNLVLGVAALSAAFTGPGGLSLDALLGWPFGGVFWGTAALIVGAIGGAIPLASRHYAPLPHAA